MISRLRARFGSLDLAAGAVLAILAVLVALTVVVGRAQGLRVQAGITGDGRVGPRGPLSLTFYDLVDQKKVEELIQIIPPAAGRFNWPSPKTVDFVPDKPWQPGSTYTLRINAGDAGSSVPRLARSIDWNFQVRPPLIAYLYSNDPNQNLEIWVAGADGSGAHQVTHSGAWVFDFDAADDGNFLVYSVYNTQQGVDLWAVDRDGGNPHMLVNCGADRCTTPAISPDGRIVAYTRESAGISPGNQYGAPRVWVASLASGDTHPLYSDQQVLGYNPSWSPDGKRVASLDNVEGGIRVVEIATGKQDILPSTTGDQLTWSPDGLQALFTDTQTLGDVYRTLVYKADFTTHQVATLIGKDDTADHGYSSLAWSPGGDQIVLGMRADPKNPASSLWIIQPDLLGGPVIADDAQYDFSAPQWDPWGTALVYQRFLLNAPLKSSVVVWQRKSVSSAVVAQGIFPRWLP